MPVSATAADVAEIAKMAVRRRKEGWDSVSLHGVRFDLDAGGWCLRFVWRCYAAALAKAGIRLNVNDPGGDAQLEYLPWAARYAVDACAVLKRGGTSACGPYGFYLLADDCVPGDIALLSPGGRPGHIAIYLGGSPRMVAENTSSGSRGDPRPAGTKITPLSAVVHELTGYARVLPASAPSVPGWADESVKKAIVAGVMHEGDPWDEPVSQERLAVFMDRAGCFREAAVAPPLGITDPH